eukprot:4330129-Amphidinium_carterae.1
MAQQGGQTAAERASATRKQERNAESNLRALVPVGMTPTEQLVAERTSRLSDVLARLPGLSPHGLAIVAGA